MKAAQFYGGKDIRVETVPDPTLEEGQVLVQVEASGICGSDLHGYHHQPEKPLSPRIGGHELAGLVIDTGKGVTGYEKGARVAVEPISPCNNCPECYNGYYNICGNLRHGGGGFAEFMVARKTNVYIHCQRVFPLKVVHWQRSTQWLFMLLTERWYRRGIMSLLSAVVLSD